MRYYIRPDKNAKLEGPFTVEALSDAIRTGQISSDALASSDLGDAVVDLHVWRDCDWFPLAAIAELRGIVPPLPKTTALPPPVTGVTVVCHLVAALGFSYSAVSERQWLIILLAVLMIFSAVDAVVRYARQREKRSPAV